MRARVPFETIARAALGHAPGIVRRWLPDGHRAGAEWIARNPKRGDPRRGSFRVNLRTGRWADFATGDRGGDLVSLAAFLFDLDQVAAARNVARMVGVALDD